MTARGTNDERRALLLGSQGGVGRAVLALLEHSAPGRRVREGLDEIVLVDCRQPEHPVPLSSGILLPPIRIGSAEDLGRLVREQRIGQVIDLSSLDTVDCTRMCDEEGAHFLCTSVEEWPAERSIPTDEAIARLLPPRRPALNRRSHLVGSGANPGIVNALVFGAIEAFAERAGTEATPAALDLHAVLVTEEDTTVDVASAESSDVFAMTWSPAHCLEELFEPAAFVARDGVVASLGHAPTACTYRARCGETIIEGFAVPHEEIATLAWRLSGVEIGFVYRLPPSARHALAAHPERTAVGAWPTRRLYPPWTTTLRGHDRVGVLLCSRRFGELWFGFETDVQLGLRFGTNATQLQVAAGVLAGWSQLGARTGIHFVEDLDWRAFLAVASAILGEPVAVHDPAARPKHIADRVATVPEPQV